MSKNGQHVGINIAISKKKLPIKRPFFPTADPVIDMHSHHAKKTLMTNWGKAIMVARQATTKF